jgi:hypothetical protein
MSYPEEVPTVQHPITRAQFKAAIEEGIIAAEERLAEGINFAPPEGWRASLRKVGDEASRATRVWFNQCPVTLAGLRPDEDEDEDAEMSSALMEFACAFDAALKTIVGHEARELVIGVTRKQREAEEDVLIEESIRNTNAECDYEVGSRRPACPQPTRSWRGNRLIDFMRWAAAAPFAADLVACAETNS